MWCPFTLKILWGFHLFQKPLYTKCLKFYFPSSVQHKTQQRQLHAVHPDDHHCTTLFKYFKSKAVEETDRVMTFYSDDKSKIQVGEPDAPASTGVRGRESITARSVTLEALDHDMHKSSLTPNAALRCDILASTDKSVVRRNIYYNVSDSVFQSSSPFLHGVMLCKITKEL